MNKPFAFALFAMAASLLSAEDLFLNGEYMPAGTYTKANLPAMEPSGDTGALVVLRGRAGAFMIVR